MKVNLVHKNKLTAFLPLNFVAVQVGYETRVITQKQLHTTVSWRKIALFTILPPYTLSSL